jgi:anti-sigma regulatory factor (Ser/Thr protein kinase)
LTDSPTTRPAFCAICALPVGHTAVSSCAVPHCLLVGDADWLDEQARALPGPVSRLSLAQLLASLPEIEADLLLLQAPAADDEAAWRSLLAAVEWISRNQRQERQLLLLGQPSPPQVEAFLRVGGQDLISDDPQGPLFFLRLAQCCKRWQQQWELQAYRTLVAREESIARAVLGSVVRDDLQRELPNLRWRLSPRALYNGDLILAAKSPLGRIHLLLGDFPGKGLAASIGVLPVAEIFYTMTAKGFELEQILLEINQRLKGLLPIEGFLAAGLLEIDLEQGIAGVWNGGLPCLLVQRARAGLEHISSRHTPLGIVDNAQFDASLERLSLHQGDHLLLATGGHAELLQGQHPEALAKMTAEAPLERALERLSDYLQQHRGLDEVSLLMLRIGQPVQRKRAEDRELLRGSGSSTRWSYEILLDPDTLREFDPRPMLTQLLVEVQGLQAYREQLYTLVAELFSNALEHGVLRLDSGLKASPEGFGQYYSEREERLEQLQQGYVRFGLEHQPLSHGGLLSIEVEDSGPGFDYINQGKGELSLEGFCGRGIGLIRKMAEDVVYFPPGNRVKITYPWTHSP